MLAAMLGSVITIVSTQWLMESKQPGVRIEQISGVPASQIGYTKNESGEIVPLDFTGTAERVTKAVVHIRSTQQKSVPLCISDQHNKNLYAPINRFLTSSGFSLMDRLKIRDLRKVLAPE